MNIRGIVFVGTRTTQADEMTAFVRDVLRLQPATGDHAAFFTLPDGSSFAVQATDAVEERTVGLLVDDVEHAAAELRAAGTEVGETHEWDGLRYAHFRAPDGRLYELVERLPVDAGKQSGEHDRTS